MAPDHVTITNEFFSVSQRSILFREWYVSFRTVDRILERALYVVTISNTVD
jgi:hypothetical protein